ncbi:MAG: ATP-binding protein [Candidatus Omnitrophota bacterium]
MYIKRDIEKVLKEAAGLFPAVIVTGPRQSGKTTLLKHLFSKTHSYVSMDEPDTRLMASRDPALFFENHKPPIIIDEVQYVPQIFSYIKTIIDADRKAKGQFLLTGSQSFPLMNNVSESLAGRLAVLTLLNLSLREQFNGSAKISMVDLKKRAISGGFPEIIAEKKTNSRLWFSGYLQTYLERDVRQLRQIGDITDFQRFLEILAAFNGQVINLSSLSRDIGVAVNTVKSWISILEASHQIISVKPYYLNKGKRIIKSPKIYFLDTGLLCYISGITSIDQVFHGIASGQLLETLVLGELVRMSYNKGDRPKVFYWRTSYGEEVDFIVENKDKVVPIEVKMSSRANVAMSKGIKSFCELFPQKSEEGIVITVSGERTRLGEKIIAIPFNEFIKKYG